MNREELTALRAVIDGLLALPDRALVQVAQWFAPEPAKSNGRGDGQSNARELSQSNGHDPHPAAAASASIGRSGPLHDLPPRAAQARPGKAAKATAGEKRLLSAMEAHPGLSANGLAKAAGMSRSTAGDRLRRLSAMGAIEKSPDGWRIAGDGPRPPPPPPPMS